MVKTNRTKRQIFFVDDDLDVCKSIRKSLEQHDLKVRCFSNAADCLKQLRSQKCDLLITDVVMRTPEEMDGIELLIKAKRIVPGLPVLVITAYPDALKAFNAGKEGAVGFLKKPLDRSNLLSTVDYLLKLKDKTNNTLPEDKLNMNQKPFKSDGIFSEGEWAEIVKELSLSPRQAQVVKQLLFGLSDKQIAAALKITLPTVRTHITRLFSKFSVQDRNELVLYIIYHFLKKPPSDSM